MAEKRRLGGRFRQFVSTVRSALSLTAQASPAALGLGIAAASGTALIPPLMVWLGKLLVDDVVSGSRSGTQFEDVLPAVFVLGVATALQRSLTAVLAHRQALFSTMVELHAERRFLENVSAADLGHLDQPDWHDRAARASRDLSWRPYQLATGVLTLAGASIGLIAMLGLVTALSPWVALLAVGSVAPVALVQRTINRDLHDVWAVTTGQDRQRRYARDFLSHPETAKDVRAFGLSDYLLNRHNDVAQSRLATLKRLHARADRRLVPASAVGGILLAAAYGLVAQRGLSGDLSAGDVALAIGAFAVVTSHLSSLLNSLAAIDQSAAFLGDYFSFLTLEPLVPIAEDPVPLPATLETGIRFEGVCLAYPGSGARPAVSDLDLEVRPGELIAIVGENGSGKTTLIKLLLRFYDPDTGSVKVGGVDVRKVNPSELRSRIGVLFQDFARPEMTLRDNVGLGRVEREPTDEAVIAALAAAHADHLVSTMRQGLDSSAGRLFEGGHDLSGGEWQRLALARLMFRDADIWVLDEPTSGLDAEVEAAIFANLRQQLKGRIGIVISHRFSTVRIADRIAVMAGGQITELGTHDELIALGRTYARMFDLQASAYR